MKLTTKIAYAIFPPYVWLIATKELNATKCRFLNIILPSRRRLIRGFKGREGLKIHLGCGKNIVSGWINVDYILANKEVLPWDLRSPLPFKDNSAQMIYHEHVLEHFLKEEAVSFLKECYRILAPQGAMRIGVPDAGLYFRAYAEGNSEFFRNLQNLGNPFQPLAEPIDVINQMMRMGFHHFFSWDRESLSRVLTAIGFINIRRYAQGEASRPEFCLDNSLYQDATLYLEAEKPVQHI